MSEEEKNITSRRDAIKKIFQGAGLLTLGGIAWGSATEKAVSSPLVLRPPAALPEKDFVSACTKCGKCVVACPYDTLKIAEQSDEGLIGTPYFIARDIPCYMCPDVPCVEVCPTDALDLNLLIKEKEKNVNVKLSTIGVAVIDQDTCIAFDGIQCDACYRACPFIDEAITVKFEKNTITNKHANLIPVVNSESCTGCGLCEHVCVTEKASITIIPNEVIKGKLSNHYIKSWDKKDEKRISTEERYDTENKSTESAQEYLNDGEDLLDD